MLVLGAQTIALLIVVPALCFFVGMWLFRKDTEIEARRKAAMTITAKLDSLGLKRLPRITAAYAVGDYSGLAHEIKSFADLILGDPNAVTAEFDATFAKVLDLKLTTAEGRALISAKFNDALKAAQPVQ